jgi:hypothetical protein
MVDFVGWQAARKANNATPSSREAVRLNRAGKAADCFPAGDM